MNIYDTKTIRCIECYKPKGEIDYDANVIRGLCRMVSPIVDELAEEYEDKVNFVKVDVDQNKDLAKKYNIYSIPTLAIFKDGEIISQQAGASTKESFKTMIDSSLN